MSWENHITSVDVSVSLDPHEYHPATTDMIKHSRIRQWDMSGVEIEFEDMDDYRNNAEQVVKDIIEIADAISDALRTRDRIRRRSGEEFIDGY
jgi:ABC-type Zn uptake system ZnuABC Zn-binding protein ZnuA